MAFGKEDIIYSQLIMDMRDVVKVSFTSLIIRTGTGPPCQRKNMWVPSRLLESLCKWQPIKTVIILPWRENGLKKTERHEIKIQIRNLDPNWLVWGLVTLARPPARIANEWCL